ncbi:MAG: hypothetical protein ACYS22_13975 [Planctomycetota bacterium]|jgi:hypothetical protein
MKTTKLCALVALFVLATSPAWAQNHVPYQAGFDNGVPSGWQMNGLWNADGNPASVPGGATHSGSGSLNFNNGVDYPGVQRAACQSPTIIGLAPLAHTLTFRCNYQTETTGTDWDRRKVVVRRNGNTVKELTLSSRTSASTESRCAAMGLWHEHAVEIAGSTATRTQGFQVEFVFDSVDDYANNYAGWFVDDFRFDAVQNQTGPVFDTLTRATQNFRQHSIRFEIGSDRAVTIYQSSPTARYAPINGQATSAEFQALTDAVSQANLASIPQSIPDPNVYVVAPTTSLLTTTSSIPANVNSIGSSLGVYGQWSGQLVPVMSAIQTIQDRLLNSGTPTGDDHGDTPQAATSIALNQPATSGAIDPAGDVDFFKAVDTEPYIEIWPPVQRTYTFETAVVNNMDTVIELFAANGTTPIATNDDGGAGLASKIVHTASAGSSFYLKVRHYSTSGTGSYTLEATSVGGSGGIGSGSDDHGNTPGSATALSAGAAPVAGSLDAGDVDYFAITMNTIAIFPPPVYELTIETTVTSADTVIELYKGQTLIAANDDAPGLGLGSRIVHTDTASSYYIKVRHYSSTGEGNYAISVKQTLVP